MLLHIALMPSDDTEVPQTPPTTNAGDARARVGIGRSAIVLDGGKVARRCGFASLVDERPSRRCH